MVDKPVESRTSEDDIRVLQTSGRERASTKLKKRLWLLRSVVNQEVFGSIINEWRK